MNDTALPLPDVMSLWEIAHRWHNEHPDASEPTVPIAVQDTLRLLTKAAYRHDLSLCSNRGTIFGNDRNTTQYEDMDDPDGEAYASWEAHYHKRLHRHNEAAENFPECFEQRKFDKELLSNRFTTDTALKDFCDRTGISLPAFWRNNPNVQSLINNQTTKIDQPLKKLRNDQVDKQLVQAIARTLWDIDPNLTIQALKEHPAVLKYGNGAQYTPKTRHNWIKEVDPRPLEKKRGRPRKNSS